DGMALNRLYILENEKGVFWSNRPSALLIFSETNAELDIDSWKIYATAGWFVNETSPFKNIKRVKPGILYEININDDQLYEISETNSINNLIDIAKNKKMDYKIIANDMKREMESFNQLWEVNFSIDLSGGADSRLSASNALYTNIKEYEFRSIEDIAAEVSKAKYLLEIEGTDKKINIIDPLEYISKQESLSERVNKILFEFDGDFATVMMNSPIIENNDFQTLKNTQVSGFGGAIAKGSFYSNQRWIEKLYKHGSEAAFYRLSTHFIKVGCTTEEAINLMNEEFKQVLNIADFYQFKNLNKLDFFQFYERFRRWSPSGDRFNFYSPFYNKSFISIGLTNNPYENINYSVHKKLIHQMTPKWDDISFFKATPEQSKEKDKKNLRLWQTKDKDSIEKILENSDTWNDVFIEQDVKQIWDKAKTEGIPNYQETLFQRVVLRSLFNEHLNFINKHVKN